MPKPCFPSQASVQGLWPHAQILVQKLQQRGAGEGSAPTKDDAEEKDNAFPTPNGALMIFGGSTAYDSKRRQKVARREVYTAGPATPAFLRWSESAITFDWTNHPDAIPHPRRYPLVVDPIVDPKRLTKVLMDGGSGLNIMYAKTLDEMGVDRTKLHPIRAPFHGVVLGRQAIPLG